MLTSRPKFSGKSTFLMSLQVIDVHKPLLAVCELVAAGHRVIFNEDSPHILHFTGEKVNLSCVGGTCEVEMWIRNPGFTRQSGSLSRHPRS